MKRFMPFWFWDIIKTEQRLCALERAGLRLTGFSPLTGVFSFEECEKNEAVYRICYAKGCGGLPPKGITAAGWESVCGTGNLYIIKYSGEAPGSAPSYNFWKTLNRIFTYLLFFVVCFIAGAVIGMTGAAIDTHGVNLLIGRIISSPRSYIALCAIALFIAALRVNKKLSKTGIDLGLKGKVLKTVPAENFIYSAEEEKAMLKSGRMIKRAPIGWFYSPDKAEEMVEKMAAKGLKFYRFNNLGTVFYFVKSEPRGFKFVVDYQNEASDEYFAQCRDDGWKLEFTSVTRGMSFIIWSKEYELAETPPEFYSDSATMLKRAKRMAYTFGVPFLIFAAFMIYILIMLVEVGINEDSSLFAVIPVYLICIAEFLIFAARTIGYYLRSKKKYSKNK